MGHPQRIAPRIYLVCVRQDDYTVYTLKKNSLFACFFETVVCVNLLSKKVVCVNLKKIQCACVVFLYCLHTFENQHKKCHWGRENSQRK